MFLTITRRQILAGLAVAALVVVGGVGMTLAQSGAAVAVGSDWGMSFPQAGQPPIANATAEELAAYDAFYLGDTAEKRLYLTFDAGYENGHTAAILDALKAGDAALADELTSRHVERAMEHLLNVIQGE